MFNITIYLCNLPCLQHRLIFPSNSADGSINCYLHHELGSSRDYQVIVLYESLKEGEGVICCDKLILCGINFLVNANDNVNVSGS